MEMKFKAACWSIGVRGPYAAQQTTVLANRFEQPLSMATQIQIQAMIFTL